MGSKYGGEAPVLFGKILNINGLCGYNYGKIFKTNDLIGKILEINGLVNALEPFGWCGQTTEILRFAQNDGIERGCVLPAFYPWFNSTWRSVTNRHI